MGEPSQEQSQPKQPHNLQGLMRFALEATRAEDAPETSTLGPMDEERRQFLEKTLKSLTTDVIEVLQVAIKTLVTASSSTDLEEDEEQRVDALETILEHVDNIDLANDFFKIGGFAVIPKCLESSYSEVRSRACELLAVLAQNNPFCQDRLVEAGLLSSVLDLISTREASGMVAVKAMSAVSCIVRNNESGLLALLACGGLEAVLGAVGTMESADGHCDKLRTKGAFLLRALCIQDNKIRAQLITLNSVEIIGAVLMIAAQSREHLLSALMAIVGISDSMDLEYYQHVNDPVVLDEIGEKAAEKLRKPELSVKKTLDLIVKDRSGKPEYREEVEYSLRLLRNVFSEEILHGDESAER